jgi:hypothetical protein
MWQNLQHDLATAIQTGHQALEAMACGPGFNVQQYVRQMHYNLTDAKNACF